MNIKPEVEEIFNAATAGEPEAEGEQQEASPYDDKEKISKRIDEKLAIDKFYRSMFERGWFRNILFYVGSQFIVYDRSTNRWRPRQVPNWFPKSQTNKFAEKANDIISEIVQAKPVIRYSPATEDPDDMATAEIGERIREVLYAEADIDSKEMELAAWLVLTGTVFLVPYYDTDEKYGMRQVPGMECLACGYKALASAVAAGDDDLVACPDCGQPMVESSDPSVEESFPVGSLNADVCSPFEIRLDHRVRRPEDLHWFIRLRRYDLAWANERWGRSKADDNEFTPDNGDNLSQYYLDAIAQVSDSFAAPSGATSPGGSEKNPKVTAYEHYELPSEDFPEGLYAVRIGTAANNVVEAKPLPTEFGAGQRKGQKFLNLVKYSFDTVPGRFWGKTRMDDLIPLQVLRNRIEANLTLAVQRMGNAVWLDPKGSGVDIITGEPGQRLRYNPVSLGGTSFAKPERLPADTSALQPFIIYLNKIDDSMERVAGTFFLGGGDAPPGVQAASALAYLGERAQKAMSPLLREWAKGWMRFEEMGLEIARANWDDQRMRVVAGLNKRWEVQKFSKADLQGAVNLKIDYNSLAAKSSVTDRAEIAQLIQVGALNPQDPETQMRILEKFGKTGLRGSVDLDSKQAIKEADEFLTANKPPRLVPMVQNSIVHLMHHNDFAKTDEFEALPQEKQDLWYAHIQAHVADLVARQQAFSMLGVDPTTKPFDEAGTAQVQAAAGMVAGQQPGEPAAPLTADQLASPTSPASRAMLKRKGASAEDFAPVPDIAAPAQPAA